MYELLPFIFIAYIIITAMALAAANDDDSTPSHVFWVITFWPVTVPIFLAFGLFYAIYAAFRISINMFGETK